MIKVIFFGTIAERLGKRSLDVSPNQSLAEVIEAADCAAFSPFLIAVNQEQINDMSFKVKAGDEVAIMPPFSGG